jgi:hypothetical protein
VGTPNYGFTLPAFGTGSWHEPFFWAFPHSVEAAVRSAEASQHGRGSVVMSVCVGNSIMLGFDDLGRLAGNSRWVVLSAAPVGAFADSFQIVAPGHHGYFRYTQSFLSPGHVASDVSFQNAFFWRAIVMPGSIDIAQASHWAYKNLVSNATGTDGHEHVDFTAIRSLGPGQYSVVVEHRHFIFNATGSGFAMWPSMGAQLSVWEVELG